ncbi:TSCOT protein, partial [Polyodon spathula]|nr:TSCOT protein [Polyodon spathula]
MSCIEFIEPVVFAAQVASAFYDTGLLMVVKERYNVTSSNSSLTNSTDHGDNEQQTAVSDFLMIYSMISGFVPFLPAFFLARLGDKRNRKIPICVPLVGYMLSRLMLLLVILLQWSVKVMFGAAVVYSLFGGFSSYWAGVMALASAGSDETQRSIRLIRIELVYGVAGFIGSILSGHIFNLFHVSQHQGVMLVGISGPDNAPTVADGSSTSGTFDLISIVLLFAGAILYDVSVSGAMDILPSFVIKEPLSWGAELIGYGNAAGFVIFITSFLGVYVFSKCLRDTTMIIIGMVSFGTGILVMAFVRKTYMFYIARALNLFALIPMPTIRSLLSKQVQGSSYGKIFILLQMSFTVASVATSPIFTKIYQATLVWFAGFCFILSCILSILAIIPIGIVGYRTGRHGYTRLPSN